MSHYKKTKGRLGKKTRVLYLIPGLLLLGTLVSCGSGSGSSSGSSSGSEFACPDSSSPHILDKNGDNQVRMGIATPGPRNDGAYYQALVETAQKISAEECFEEVIVVDNITPAQAESILRNLASQDVDFIAVGGTDIANPLIDLVPEFSDILWYCNCGAGFAEVPGLVQSRDDSSEINYSAGQATGLLLQRTGGNEVLFLGCCDLDFEEESLRAFELGLEAVDPNYEISYIATGAYPFDFNNISVAVEALTAVADEIDAVYPFLGEAHEPVIQRANREGIITLSAGASDVCEREDLNYDIAVRFDAGDYLEVILREIVAGELVAGETRKFSVGQDPQVGALICEPTESEAEKLMAVYADIAAGNLDEAFAEIKSQIYS